MRRPVVVVVAWIALLGGCGDESDLSERQAVSRDDVRNITQSAAEAAAPGLRRVASEGVDDSDCPDGTLRLTSTIDIFAEPGAHRALLAAIAEHWRENASDELAVSADRVVRSSGAPPPSDWTVVVTRSDDRLVMIGRSACIP